MKGKQQAIQMELEFPSIPSGEALGATRREQKPFMATPEHESPTEVTERLMEEIVRAQNLRRALKRVKANKGCSGIDRMKVEELPDYLKEHWPQIKRWLLEGRYLPKPVRRSEIPKAEGGKRKLGIPTVLDRFIQQAIVQVLQSEWDKTFSEHSFGFRPKRSAHQAVAAAQQRVKEGYKVVVDIDLEKFFDRVNHDILMSRVAKRVKDKRVLKLIRRYLEAGMMEGGLVGPTSEGVPQGGPLSPLLSNLMLDDLDKELERRGHWFVRYADDCNIYVRTQRAGERVMESVSRFITRKLKLKVNESKSTVDDVRRRSFLGFNLQGVEAKRWIAPKALKRFKDRVRYLTGRSRAWKMERRIEELNRYLRGWKEYFGYAETSLKDLDYWIARRLRAALWKQWKNANCRFKELRRNGVSAELACIAHLRGKRGSWRASMSRAMTMAYSSAKFQRLGLIALDVP